MADTKPHIQEKQVTPSRMNAPTPVTLSVIFKLQKIKDEKVLKEARGKRNTLQRNKDKS